MVKIVTMYRTESGGLFETEQEARAEEAFEDLVYEIKLKDVELFLRELKTNEKARAQMLAYLQFQPDANKIVHRFLLTRLGILTDELIKYQSYNGPPTTTEQELVVKIALLNSLISELK